MQKPDLIPNGRPINLSRIAQYIAERYAATRKPVCASDIIAALDLPKSSVNTLIRVLHRDGVIRHVGIAADTDRSDLKQNTLMFGPRDAAMLPFRDVPVAARPPLRLRSEPPGRAYLGKPVSARVERVKSPPYRGAVGNKYVPEFKPSSGREFWTHKELCEIARRMP